MLPQYITVRVHVLTVLLCCILATAQLKTPTAKAGNSSVSAGSQVAWNATQAAAPNGNASTMILSDADPVLNVSMAASSPCPGKVVTMRENLLTCNLRCRAIVTLPCTPVISAK